jgi:hypothetical protein
VGSATPAARPCCRATRGAQRLAACRGRAGGAAKQAWKRVRRRRNGLLERRHGRPDLRGNQIAFLNEWTMDPDVREYLKAQFGPTGLPFTTLYGEGGPLTEETVEHINEVYDLHTEREPWQAGDVMLVDNIRMPHSREPYTGRREVVVAMGNGGYRLGGAVDQL